MSPDELIEEIILVDDGSTLDHLGDRLQKVAIFMFLALEVYTSRAYVMLRFFPSKFVCLYNFAN